MKFSYLFTVEYLLLTEEGMFGVREGIKRMKLGMNYLQWEGRCSDFEGWGYEYQSSGDTVQRTPSSASRDSPNSATLCRLKI